MTNEEKYKVAICLHGLVGNSVGKSYDSYDGAKEVLRLSVKHWFENVVNVQENTEVDFFTHSWSVGLEEDIVSGFKPKKYLIEPERTFEIPKHVVGTEDRKQAHWHRWYSCQQAVKMKKDYEEKNNFIYDCVMFARYDLAWTKAPKFKEYDQNKFWVSNWYHKNGKVPAKYKCKDFWFFSSSANIDKYANLYDNLNKYTLPGASGQNGVLGVSSHHLTSYHLNKLKFPVGYTLKATSQQLDTDCDFPVIRYVYFKPKI